MKIVVTGTPPGSTVKAGERLDLTGEKLTAMLEGGFAVTASEWDAAEAAKAEKVRAREAGRNRIKAAVLKAKERKAILPKDEVVEATWLKRFDDGKADEEVAVEAIDSLMAREEREDRDAVQARWTRPDAEAERTGDYSPRVEVGVSVRDAAEGVLKCTEPQSKLIKSGKEGAIEAVRLAREASVIVKHHLLKAGKRVDFLLRDTVKGATTTDPDSQVGSLAGDLVIMRNLGFLVNKLPWIGKLTTDLSGEPAKFGQSVLTRYITPPDVLTWVPGVGFTSQANQIADSGTGTTQSVGKPLRTEGPGNQALDATNIFGKAKLSAPSTTDVSVKLEMFKATEIEFPVSLLAGTVRNLFSEQLSAQTYALAENINTDVLGKMLAETWGTGGVAGLQYYYTKALATFGLPDMIRIKNKMTIAKIPDVGRYVLLHSFYHDKILEDANLLAAKALMAIIHKDESEFNTGEIPTLFGLKPLESQLASATTAGALTTWVDDTDPGTTAIVGFAGNMSSYIFVSRPPQDFTKTAESLGIPVTASVRLVTEPDSGLTVMVFSYVDNGAMSIRQRVCLMWGADQGDPRTGFPIRITPP